ncbi:hypothetical protein QIS74_00559 [Colletotrichum tabaci]|uniref:Secondary metabolism regulator LAE1 n=1 Tax=Colletotrichum tabaci TaxID=1209068 RepID=A0AAV9TUD7_9PEZI
MANVQDHHQDALVADDDATDSEAELQSIRSDTTSLKSSILEYRMENGRSYHTYKDGKYAWPKDEQENDRLDMQNGICFLMFHGKLGVAPPCNEGAKVDGDLDLGTGTGPWAIEYGDQHPETELGDTWSEIGSSIASSSTSLRSSILDYRFENGRTYHSYKDGKYNIPNDQREIQRLDSQHYMWLFVLDDRLGVAPPCHPDAKVGRVLDVGTGSGIWAINFGDEHPESDVLAMDLSPTSPSTAPPNVTFEVDDLEEDWLYSRPFDYIHS